MKTPKLMVAFIAILLFSDFLFAVNPLTGDVNNFADKKVMQLSKMVNLTDSQKVLIKARANTYALQILNKDSVTYQVFLPQATQEYKVAIDSILTIEQKAQIVQIRTTRKNAAINKFKNNKQ